MLFDRQYKLETEYKFKKEDQAKSVFFQKIYGIGIVLFIFFIIIFVSGEPAVAVLIPLAIPQYIFTEQFLDVMKVGETEAAVNLMKLLF